MSQHHYVYALKDVESGRFYIGKRSSKRPPEEDKYSGSGVWPSRCRSSGKKLQKIIIKSLATESDAFEFERFLVEKARGLHPGRCMNLADGGIGLTSRAAKQSWERSSDARRSKAALNAVSVSKRFNLPARMKACTTFEQRSSWGKVGGAAGKGVSRNSGDANPMRLKASESKDVKVLRVVDTGEIVVGNWHQIKQRFGKIHCSRLKAGRVSKGLILERAHA